MLIHMLTVDAEINNHKQAKSSQVVTYCDTLKTMVPSILVTSIRTVDQINIQSSFIVLKEAV